MINPKINKWLSAVLDDPSCCEEFKSDIKEWFTICEHSTLIENNHLKDLESSSFKLDCLEAGGVDNWTWYSESLKPYWEAVDSDE